MHRFWYTYTDCPIRQHLSAFPLRFTYDPEFVLIDISCLRAPDSWSGARTSIRNRAHVVAKPQNRVAFFYQGEKQASPATVEQKKQQRSEDKTWEKRKKEARWYRAPSRDMNMKLNIKQKRKIGMA
jgi:hypothetical protein